MTRALVVAVVVLTLAGGAAAEPCTLTKPVKVSVKAGPALTWKVLAAGTVVDIRERGPKWTTASTPEGDGRVLSAALACSPASAGAPALRAGAVSTPAPAASASTSAPVPSPSPSPSPLPSPGASSAPPSAPPAMEGTASTVSAKKARRIAVYQIEHAGFDDRIATVITDSIVAEVRKLEKTSVVGMDEIKAMLDLEAQKQLAGCSDVSCVAEIAEALGVDGVIIGNMAIVGDGIAFGLKHIDQHSAQTLGQAARRIDGVDPADVLAAVGPVVQELFPDVPLKPGAARGVAAEVALRIHPPPLAPWVFWSLAGTSAAALAGGAALTAWNASAYASAQQRTQASVAGPDADGQALNADIGAVRTSFTGLVVAYAAGTVLAAGATVTALFTDWSGAGAE